MDGVGAGLWVGVFLAAGWGFSGQIDAIAGQMDRFGGWLGLALASVGVIFLLLKLVERRRVYRSLRVARITPLELKQRMESGEPITIVDLRNDFEGQEGRIPGSLLLTVKELDSFVPVGSETEMIVYCSCPNEVSSAAVAARRLRRRGVKSVRPLEGGFPGWTEFGFPVEIPMSVSVSGASSVCV